MAWRKREEEQTDTPQPEEPETPVRRNDMGEHLEGLDVALEAAEQFIKHAKAVHDHINRGMTADALKKTPELRRLRRSSLGLSSELVILRKVLP